MELEFPFRKDFPDGRFAYVIDLFGGRGRICLTKLGEEMSVVQGW